MAAHDPGNAKCGCPDCVFEKEVTKVRAAYKWNGILPMTEQREERMFWVLTWKRTVEYLACERSPHGDGWIVLRHGLMAGGVPYKEGLTLFETEYDAQTALVSVLSQEKDKLEAWIHTVQERAWDVGPAGVIVGVTLTTGTVTNDGHVIEGPGHSTTTFTITGGPGKPRRILTAEDFAKEYGTSNNEGQGSGSGILEGPPLPPAQTD